LYQTAGAVDHLRSSNKKRLKNDVNNRSISHMDYGHEDSKENSPGA
jgi:hypothetical protein